MNWNRVIVPSDQADYTYLSRSQSGRLFRKHILSKGDLRHPETGQAIQIDDAFVSRLKDNFSSSVCDIVQVPLADGQNRHSEDPTRNIGEVVDIQEDDGKVFAVIDARDDAMADRLGKTLLGASAMLHLNYQDTKTGKKVGPTLLHVCVTNRPYVTGLDDYQEIVAATADNDSDAVMLTSVEKKESAVELNELLSQLKEHGIDVAALQAKAEQADELSTSLTNSLSEAGLISLSNTETLTGEDVVGAVVELAASNKEQATRLTALERKDAHAEVKSLVKQGRIAPAQEEAMVEVRLTQPDLFDKLVPEKPLVILTGEEHGTAPADDEAHNKSLDDEIARLTAKDGAASQYIRVEK